MLPKNLSGQVGILCEKTSFSIISNSLKVINILRLSILESILIIWFLEEHFRNNDLKMWRKQD